MKLLQFINVLKDNLGDETTNLLHQIIVRSKEEVINKNDLYYKLQRSCDVIDDRLVAGLYSCEDIISENFENTDNLFFYSQLLFENNEIEKANKIIKSAISIGASKPKMIQFYILSAQINLALQKYEQVLIDLENAYKIDMEYKKILQTVYIPKFKRLPGLFINTLPKSASWYIRYCLCDGLRIPHGSLAGVAGIFYNMRIDPIMADRFVKYGNQVVQVYIAPVTTNLIALKRFNINKLVVHVRDPRQAVISWMYHIERNISRQELQNVLLETKIPYNIYQYLSLSMEQKLDTLIENFLIRFVNWIDGWVNAAEDSNWDFDIMLTRFEDMKADPKAYFQSIIKFYDIDLSYWHDENVNYNVRRNYRKGSTKEWRQILTNKQLKIANEMIPSKLFNKYGWEY